MMQSLKILSVNFSDSLGGASRAAYRIHCAVRKMDVDSRMFVKYKETTDNTVLKLSNFKKNSFTNRIYAYIQNKVQNKIQHYQWNKYPNRENEFMSDLRSVSLNGALQEIEYDVLHLHWINLQFLDLKELLKIKKPIIWTLHDCWEFTGVCHYFNDCEKYRQSCGDCPLLHSNVENDLSRSIWEQKEKVYSSIDIQIVTPSQWLADCVKKSSLLSRFPVTVIPNCLDTEVFCPNEDNLTRKNNSDNEKKKILFGAMNATGDKRKGFKQLIEAISSLDKMHIADELELLVFGSDKPIKGLQTKIPIHYLGFITNEEHLVSVYNTADVMVVPSLSENLSNAIIESMACGTPVVAFNIGGNADMIEHKKTGYLSEPLNSSDLGKGIIWCLENNMDKSLSVSARNKTIENYTPEKVGKMYIKLYNDLCS